MDASCMDPYSTRNARLWVSHSWMDGSGLSALLLPLFDLPTNKCPLFITHQSISKCSDMWTVDIGGTGPCVSWWTILQYIQVGPYSTVWRSRPLIWWVPTANSFIAIPSTLASEVIPCGPSIVQQMDWCLGSLADSEYSRDFKTRNRVYKMLVGRIMGWARLTHMHSCPRGSIWDQTQNSTHTRQHDLWIRGVNALGPYLNNWLDFNGPGTQPNQTSSRSRLEGTQG